MTFLFLLFWINIIGAQTITRLDIYYLPWHIRPDGPLPEDEVRNFNHGKNSYFCIQNSAIIDEFVKAMSIFYLRPFPEMKAMSYVMVIDISFEGGNKKTIGLDTDKSVFFLNIFYHQNFELSKWIDKYVPPAKW